MPDFLTPQDIANVLKISYDSALVWIKQSGIDYLKVGRQYRVSAEKFQAFLQRKGRVVVSLNKPCFC